MQKCDICGKSTTACGLISLLDIYQTEDIKEVCYDCNIILNKKLLEIKEVTMEITKHWMKRFIERLQGKG